MKVSPISFGISPKTTIQSVPKEQSQSEYIPTTQRKNSLADMEFNIIADTIRCQNLKNQMNVRLMNLRRRLNNCMAQNLYSKD